MKTVTRLFLALSAAVLLPGVASAITPTPTPALQEITPARSAVSASTADGVNVAGNAVDNDLGTRWSGSGDGAWLRFDLGTSRLVARLRIGVHSGNTRQNRFDIQLSADGATWDTVWSGSNSGTTTAQEPYDFPDRSARYVRYLGHGNVSGGVVGTWNSVTEIDIDGSVGAPPTMPPAPSNLQAQPAAGRVTLTWSGSNATHFRIWRRLSQCDTFVSVGQSFGFSFTDATVTDLQHYYYQVTAVNEIGESAPSSPLATTPQLQPPAAPVLSGTAGPVDSGRVDLSWTAPASAMRYTVKRGIRSSCFPGTPTTVIATVNAPATTYTDTTATPGLSYNYVVSAWNATGEGANSNVVGVAVPTSGTPTPGPTPTPCPTGTVTPPPPTPTATAIPPSGVTVQTSQARAHLTWMYTGTFNDRPTSYSIYRGTAACALAQVARAVRELEYTDTGLTNGTAYFYVIVGVNAKGESLDSEVVGGTPAAVKPLAAQNLNAFPITSGGAPAVQLNWDAQWDADTFDVQRASSTGGPYTTIATGVPNPTTAHTAATYKDVNVAAGTTYYYRVAGVNGAGSGPASNEAHADVPGGIGVPGNLRTTAAQGSVSLTWDAVSSASGYRVKRADSGCGPLVTIANVTGTTFTDPVAINRRYFYAVSAVNGGVESADSARVGGVGAVLVPAPTNLTAVDGASIQLSWTAAAGAEQYRVYRRLPYLIPNGCQGALALPDLLATLPGGTMAFADSAVSPGTRYTYTVVAVMNGAESASSNAAAATTAGTNGFPPPRPILCPTPTQTPPPPPPTMLPGAPTNVVIAAGHQQAQLTWTTNSQAREHAIYRATAPCGPYALVQRQSYGQGSRFTDTGLTNGTLYYYVVTALNSFGESPDSAETSVRPASLPPPSVRGALAMPGDARAKIQWTPAYTATSYVVRRQAPDGTFATVGTSSTDSFVDTGLVNGTSYTYRVSPANVAGNGAETSAGSVQPQSSTTYVEVTPGSATASTNDGNVPANAVDNNLGTRWSGNGNGAWLQLDLGSARPVTHVTVAGYRGNERKIQFDIALSTDGVNFVTYAGKLGTGTTTAEEPYDVPDQSARYVRYIGHGALMNAGGTSTWNSVTEISVFAATVRPTPTCATPPPTPTPYLPPTNVTAVSGDGQITVSWTSGTAPQHQVYRSTTSGSGFTLATTVPSSTTTFTDTGLTNGTRYYYYVIGYEFLSGGGPSPCPFWSFVNTSSRSPEASAVPGAVSACNKITVPAVGASASTNDGNVPANAVDGDVGTRWAGLGDGAWLRLDLGQTRSLCFAKILFYRGSERHYRFDLQTSNDGVTWTTASSGPSAAAATFETFDLHGASARYVRYLGHGNDVNLWNNLMELELYGSP
jgi:fibronectin type 3 domain-containing protein